LEAAVTDLISLVELRERYGPLVEQALAIYEASFPAEERDAPENLVRQIRLSTRGAADQEKLYHFLVGVSGEEAMALSLYSYHVRQRLGYLAYMAITAVSRGQGLGSWMFSQTMESLAQEADERPYGMCWEVERPADIQNPQERQFAERRIRFYERNGSILFPEVELLTPPVGEGLPEVTYHLMYYPLSDEPINAPDRIRAMVDVILLEGYGVAPESHYYRRAMQSIRE
jgi:GNAT superfamily N-acetyltransferase